MLNDRNGQPIAVAVTVVVLVVLIVVMATMMRFLGLYVRALVSGAPVPLMNLIGMRLRRVDAKMLVDAWIQARRAGVEVTLTQMEAHVLAGGDLPHVMAAVIASRQAGKDLDWHQASVIDLARRDVLAYVTSGAYQRGQDWLSGAPPRRPQPTI